MSDFSALSYRLLDFEKEHEMVEILVAVYLIVGLFVSVLLWTVLRASKRLDESQATKTESEQHDRPFASKTEPIHLRTP